MVRHSLILTIGVENKLKQTMGIKIKELEFDHIESSILLPMFQKYFKEPFAYEYDININIDLDKMEILENKIRKELKTIIGKTQFIQDPVFNGNPLEIEVIKYTFKDGVYSNFRLTDVAKWIIFNRKVFDYNNTGIPFYFHINNKKDITVGLNALINELHRKLNQDKKLTQSERANLENLKSGAEYWENRILRYSDEAKAMVDELFEMLKTNTEGSPMNNFKTKQFEDQIRGMINENPVTKPNREALPGHFHSLSRATQSASLIDLALSLSSNTKNL